MKNKNSGKKTLLFSILTSSPGPLVIGLGLLVGKSSTQIADFVRRSIELLAIILAFIVFSITTKEDSIDENKKRKYEKGTNIFVSIAMIISGIIMIILALTSKTEDKGNVIPGLVIAGLGFIANTFFWLKYKKIAKETDNKILMVQSRLYRAKTFVDCSVVIALSVVIFSTNPIISYYFDLVGTLCVSIYLIFTGITSLIKEIKNTKEVKYD